MPLALARKVDLTEREIARFLDTHSPRARWLPNNMHESTILFSISRVWIRPLGKRPSGRHEQRG